MRPKLPIDFNSDSAFEKLKFVEEHYEELMLAYKDIMEHLKIPVLGGGGESLYEVVSVTNPKPLYLTFKFITNPPPELNESLYYGTTDMTVDSAYIKDLVGAEYNYFMPTDDTYKYQIRLFDNGVEVDYNEVDVHYRDNADSWEPYTLKLYRVERYSDNPAEDLGDFVTAYQSLTNGGEEATNKPTDDELFRALDVDGYLISKTDTPYTYAVDSQQYTDIPFIINGGTFSTGWIGKEDTRLYAPTSGCSTSLGNHYYIDVYVGLVGSSEDQVISFDTYIKNVTDDDTPHTFNYLVSKDKIDNRR